MTDPAPERLPETPESPPAAHRMLREPAHQVSPRAPVLWAVSATLQGLFFLAVLIGVKLIGWWDVPVWVWPVYAVASIGYVAVMPTLRYRTHRWESTDTAVYTQTGWLSRERRIAPMSRVQTVDFEQTVLGRLFGLASVTVTTASAAGPVQISMIEKPVADRLVDDLTRRTEAEAGDAT